MKYAGKKLFERDTQCFGGIFVSRRSEEQTPCWTLGIKIIITLEIGHGRGGTLVIFGGHMPALAGTEPAESKKKE